MSRWTTGKTPFGSSLPRPGLSALPPAPSNGMLSTLQYIELAALCDLDMKLASMLGGHLPGYRSEKLEARMWASSRLMSGNGA